MTTEESRRSDNEHDAERPATDLISRRLFPIRVGSAEWLRWDSD